MPAFAVSGWIELLQVPKKLGTKKGLPPDTAVKEEFP